MTNLEKEFINTLNSALKRAPSYQGNLQRSLYFDDDDQMRNFLNKHKIGTPVTYDEFLSTTKGEVYNPEGQVQIYIQDSKNGKDISTFNENEQEVLFMSGSQFTVLNVIEQEGIHFILSGEI